MFFSFDQCIFNQSLLVNSAADVVQRVGSPQFILSRVFEYRGTQFIKTEKIGHIPLFI